MQRKIFSFVAVVSLFIGLAIFFWGHGGIRNYGGDVVVVIFLYALASIFTIQSPQAKLLAIGGFAFIIECAQIFIMHPGNVLRQITLGAYFDPLDLFAYAFGLFVAYAIEHIQLHKQS